MQIKLATFCDSLVHPLTSTNSTHKFLMCGVIMPESVWELEYITFTSLNTTLKTQPAKSL